MAKSVLLFLRKLFSLPFIALIHFYRLCISPLIGPQCRYLPTCSSYALESYRRYGVIKGSYLSLRRLSRCHPWCKGGCDPVP